MPDSVHRLDARYTMNSRREKILIVEDSRTFTTVLSHRINEIPGLVSVTCKSLAALREVLEKSDETYALAIVDLNLPDSPYGEVLDYMITKSVPTIVFTGTFDAATRERILDKGIVDYILKDNEGALDAVLAATTRALANRNIRVLVVDDIKSSRLFLVQLLKSQLFRVVEADTGIKAMEVLERYPDIELVLTDYHMPDMKGDELTRRIRKRYGSDKMRVIGVSSSSDRLLSAIFLKAGASDFVHRPFIAEELHYRVANNIETLKQMHRLRKVAAGDFLTGLYNRRHFYDVGPDIVKEHLESAIPCSIAIVDIDHFKRINESRGHEIGDVVLKTIASRITALLAGTSHLLCRMSGEEFAIILAGLDGEAASEFCDTICESIGENAIDTGDDQLSVTVSIGVAEVRDRESFDNYINAADQFLHMAKQRGRNHVFSDYRMAEAAYVPRIN